MGTRSPRILAGAGISLALASVVVAVISLVEDFPRGLFVLLLDVVAIAAAWRGALRRGVPRAIWLAVAVLALAGAVVVLVGSNLIETVLVAAFAVVAVGCARAALIHRVTLAPVDPPSAPVLIFNPKSGGGKATRFHLADEARRRGIEPHEMVLGKSLEETVEELLEQGADGIAVAGGDGTQALVANLAARAGVPYACIPAGTRNHFALDLGVDRDDVVGALDAFVTGGERTVDLAEVNGRVFVNNVSVGLYGDAVARAGYRDAKLKTLLDTLPEVAGAEAVASPLRWRDPDGFTHDAGLALLVSNNVYRLGRIVGSGTRPSLDRGLLGVSVIAPRGAAGRGMVRRWSLPAMEVEGVSPISVGIDGEAVTLTPPLRFTMRPAALRVRIAAQHPGCSPSAGMPDSALSGVTLLGRLALTGKRSRDD
jgi:diacylglycerol kinase family enzyme